jgi:hypothetical protein
MENDEVKLNVRLRRTTTPDLQQIMGLLRNPDVRDWLQTSMSRLLWVSTFQRSALTDWATTFSTRMIESAEKVDNMTVLYRLCGNRLPFACSIIFFVLYPSPCLAPVGALVHYPV